MNNDYSISAIIPTYNRAHLLGRSIASVLNQLENKDELIIIDDGSTDNTEEIAAQFGNRIRYVRTSNHGAGAARNRGVKESINPLIAFLDSDDEWMQGKILLQRAFMQAEKDVMFCFSNHCFQRIDGVKKRFQLNTWHEDTRNWDEILGPGKSISSIISLPENLTDFNYHAGNIYLSTLLYGNYLNVNTLIVRREGAGDAICFAEDVNVYEEWECLGRLARAGKCSYLDCETICQNYHTGPRLTSADEFERSCAKIKVMERIWGADREFLKKHAEKYQRIHDKNSFIKAKGFISRGRTKEARKELCKLSVRVPLPYHLLSAFPGPIVKILLSIYRELKRKNKYVEK